jgi:hypothetical protein
MVCVLVMLAFGVRKCRRGHWEWFYFAHHLFVAVTVLGILHDNNLGWLMLPGISAYVLDKVIRRMRTQKCDVRSAVMLGGEAEKDVLCLRLIWRGGASANRLGGLRGDMRPGQHVQVDTIVNTCYSWVTAASQG